MNEDNILKLFYETFYKYDFDKRSLPDNSLLTRHDLEHLEIELKSSLPESFKKWCYLHPGGDFHIGGIALPRVRKESAYQDLKDEFFNEGISDEAILKGILPFGWSEDWGGWLCFDTREGSKNQDWPVRIIDHEESLEYSLNRRAEYANFAMLLLDLVKMMEKLIERSNRFV